MRHSNTLVFMLLVLWLVGVVSPLAAESDVVETMEVKGRIYSREPQSKNMVIISAQNLETLNIDDFGELFSLAVGVVTSRRGPMETSFDLGMRGSNFEQVLVMVNGVPFNNPQTGHFNTDFPFHTRDVERVEIIRGGSSTTFGAGAFAGVINIILKKENELQAALTGGDKNFFSSRLSLGKKIDRFSLRFSSDKSNSAGFHPGREFDQLKLSAGSSYASENTNIDFHFGYLDKDFGAQGFYAPYPSTEKISSYFYQFQGRQLIGKTTLSVDYSYHRHEDFFTLDRYRPAFFQNESLTGVHSLNLGASYRAKRFSFTGGLQWLGEKMDSSTMGIASRNSGALYININYAYSGKGSLDLGIRRNILPGGHSNFTYYSGFYQEIAMGLALRAGYGKSFRMPSFTELYYNSPANLGNPELQPEASHNLEVSLSWLTGKHYLDASIFYRGQDNLIDWLQYPGSQAWQAVNIENHDLWGLELTHQFLLGKTNLLLGVEKLFVLREHEDFVSKYGLRFPHFNIKAHLRQPVTRFLDIAANYTYKAIYRTEEKAHFLDLVLGINLGHLRFSARLDNLFNTIIEEIPGVKIPGRWFYLTIEYR